MAATHFRVWAPAARDLTLRGERPKRQLARDPARARGRRILLGARARCGRRRSLPVPPRRRRCCPIRRRAFSPRVRSGRRRSSIRHGFRWTDPAWRGVDARAARSSTRCTSGPSRAEGTWRSAMEQAAAARRARRHRARSHAGRRVSRPLRLGLRRRLSVRADAPVRHARRLPRVRRSRACARPRRHPRRRLQPPRPGRLRLRQVRDELLHQEVRQRVGRGAELRRPRLGAGARVLRVQRGLLDRRVPPRRPSPRRDAEHSRQLDPTTSSPRSARRRAARPRGRDDHPRRRERAAGRRACCGRSSRAATASMRSGTTTFITARRSR